MTKRFIVAEVSKNWIDGRELLTEAGLIAQRFEHVIAVNLARGYRLHSFTLHRLMTSTVALNETIIAVFERVHPLPTGYPITEGEIDPDFPTGRST